MDKWEGKVAVVTGASAGIGLAIASELVRQGMTVVGLARREEKIQVIQGSNTFLRQFKSSSHDLQSSVVFHSLVGLSKAYTIIRLTSLKYKIYKKKTYRSTPT